MAVLTAISIYQTEESWTRENQSQLLLGSEAMEAQDQSSIICPTDGVYICGCYPQTLWVFVSRVVKDGPPLLCYQVE